MQYAIYGNHAVMQMLKRKELVLLRVFWIQCPSRVSYLGLALDIVTAADSLIGSEAITLTPATIVQAA